MLEKINPMYTEFLVINFDQKISKFHTLYHKLHNIPTGNMNDDIIQEDDCLIAYSDKPSEIAQYRNKLISEGLYKPIELYIKTINNLKYYKSC